MIEAGIASFPRALGLFPRQIIDRDDDEGVEYLVRWHLTPWTWWPKKWDRVFLHRFSREDMDPAPHDHPFRFRSIILWGGYWEEVLLEKLMPVRGHGGGFEKRWVKEWYDHKWLSSYVAEPGRIHKIQKLMTKVVWTLVFRGPKVQDWGFWPRDDQYRPYKVVWWKYLGLPEPDEPAYGAADN